MFKCAFCEKPQWEYGERWFVCPSSIYRPNQYSVCEEHDKLSLKYEDVYLDDGTIIIRHEDKVKNNDKI